MRLLIAALLAVLPAFGQVQAISDTLTNAVGGGAFTGRITVVLNAPGNAQPLYYGTTSLTGWQAVYCLGVTGDECTTETAAGVFAASLYATTTITPTGTSYGARFAPTRGQTWNETWTPAVGHTKLYQIRSTTVPTPATIVSLSQIAQGAATTNQALVWNGSAWTPTTLNYTATAVMDVASVPDGTCILHSTAVTVTGAALGGRPTLGASVAWPEAIKIEPKVTGPNSMKLEICNHSGASYNPASATYYFGVTP